MKKRKVNLFDIIIESLADSFSKVKGFSTFQDSEEGKRSFDFIVKSISDLEDFQSLFLNYFIPATNKAIHNSWSQMNNSKYKNLLNITRDDLKENLYETIRMGYVILFHKYESYLKSLVNHVDMVMKEVYDEYGLLPLNDYCKKEFQIDIFKSHNLFPSVNRINYVSNCVKHYDGYPHKKPIHPYFTFSNKNEKIKLDKENLKHDINMLKLHCQNLLSQLTMMGFKQFLDMDYEEIKDNFIQKINDQNLKLKYQEIMNNFDTVLYEFKNKQPYQTKKDLL